MRRAYAARLKSIDREDADAFQRLRSAYDAARARSKQSAAKKRPSMADLAHQAPSVSVEIPVVPETGPEPNPEPNQIATTENPAPETVTAPEPPKKPFPEAPEIDDLDRLHDAWPRETKAAFMQRLRGAIVPRYGGQTADLRALLSLNMAQDFEFRRQIEVQVFNVMEQNLRNGAGEGIDLTPNLGRALDYEFGWYSDGVGFHRRFRGRQGTQQIIEKMQEAVGSSAAPKKKLETKNLHYVASFLVCWALTALFWGIKAGDYDHNDVMALGLFVLPALFACWFFSAIIFIVIDFIFVRIVRPLFGGKWNDLRKRSPRIARIDGTMFRAMHNSETREKIVIWMSAALLSGMSLIISLL